MQQRKIKFFKLLGISVGFIILSGCQNKQVAMPPNDHARALSVAAQGTALLLKQPERSIEYYQQASQLEPSNREWKASLAFAFYKAKRIPEAVPIWQDLAKGNDDIASQSKHLLGKVGAKP
jgi:tetratricopeptide (TPR) repeat protein